VRRESVLALSLASVVAAVTGTATWAHYRLLPSGQALRGTFVAGGVPTGEGGLGDWLESRRVVLLEREAYLELPDGSGNLKSSFGQLGIDLDVAETLRRTREHAGSGSIGSRLHRAWRARQALESVEPAWSFDPVRARARLQELAPEVWRDPVDARLDLVAQRRIEARPGQALDVEATLARLEQGERDEHALFSLAVSAVPAEVTTEMLADIDVSKQLAGFETKFGGTGAGRAINIAAGAAYLNGTVIAPDQTISFNQIVGPRRVDRGFTWAPVIIDDETEPGVGGGTCQVASTLHAAAVYGGLAIVERRSHSRPSGYAPLGLDATVVYGEVDLRLRNPYRSALIVHAFLPTQGTLRIELLGHDPPGKVTHTYGVMRAYESYRRVWTKPWLLPGKRIRRQRGTRGYDVISVVKVEHSGGQREERRYFSWYRPVPEVFWVGPGTDLGELPELPAGVERVEVDGAARDGAAPGVAVQVDNPADPYERTSFGG
jgi:vancomycin resistance protein YoaR